MATKQEYAQLSLYVYNVTGTPENRPNLLVGWTALEYHPDDAIGFSYGIFQNSVTQEVVVAYTGTNEKKVADFLLANLSRNRRNRGQIPIIMMQNHPLASPHGPTSPPHAARLPAPRHPAR